MRTQCIQTTGLLLSLAMCLFGCEYADRDQDGFPGYLDCDDDRADVYPGAQELPGDGIDNDCDPTSKDVDEDGDGFVAPEDCDDSDETIHPDAVERCDDVDNDCNGEVDESGSNAGIWYLDEDGDGYGTEAGTVTACSRPGGYAPMPGDCDDQDEGVHPDGDELPYNGLDDDCNSATADDDLDDDGYGIETDCDDSKANTNPEAEEVCDGLDNDCDGDIDEGLAEGDAIFYNDADGDGYGDAEVWVEGCSPPPGYAANGGDCDDEEPRVNPGETELPYDGLDNDCDESTLDDDLDQDGYVLAEECDDLDASQTPETGGSPDGYEANDTPETASDLGVINGSIVSLDASLGNEVDVDYYLFDSIDDSDDIWMIEVILETMDGGEFQATLWMLEAGDLVYLAESAPTDGENPQVAFDYQGQWLSSDTGTYMVSVEAVSGTFSCRPYALDIRAE